MPVLRSYEEFWPYYQREHARPLTRWLHFAGTSLAILCFLVAAIAGSAWWAVAAPVVAYAIAWFAHFVIERNRPATFTHPLWSLRADFHMYVLMWRGRMPPPPELNRAN